MAFSESKYQSDILGARASVLEFGVAGIKIERLNESADAIPDASSASLGSYEELTDYSFAVLIVPYKSEMQEQNLLETYNKEEALLVLEQNTLTEVSPLQTGDQFTLSDRTYKIASFKEINPDKKFPILFQAVIE